MSQPNDQAYASAIRELELAGITGSDARTAFEGACKLIGSHDYTEWLDEIGQLDIVECFARYGHDSGRAVYVLGHPTGHDDGPDCD